MPDSSGYEEVTDPNEPACEPGRILRVKARESRGRLWSMPKHYNVEVLERTGDELLVKTIDSHRKAFYLDVARLSSRDPTIDVRQVDTQPEPWEKEDFRTHEIRKLQTAVLTNQTVDNRGIMNGSVEYEGFVLACSRYIAKASMIPIHAPSLSNDDFPQVSLRILNDILLEFVHTGEVVEVREDVHIKVQFDYEGEARVGICCVEDMDYHSAKFVRSEFDNSHTPEGFQRPALNNQVHFKILAERELHERHGEQSGNDSVGRQIYLTMEGIKTDRRGNPRLLAHAKEIMLERLFSHGRPFVEHLPHSYFEVGSHMREHFVRTTLTEIAETMAIEEQPPDLVDFRKHRCYAVFGCGPCNRKWTTVMGWGVYDGAGDVRLCDCDVDRKRLVGCIHTFKCIKDCREEPLTGKWVPNRNATSVSQWCKICDSKKVASHVEVYYNQSGAGRHLPEFCPECCYLRKWCAKNAKDACKLSRELQKMLHIIDPGLTWQPGEVGVQCRFRDRETQQKYVVQVCPELFIIPEHACGEGNNPRDGAMWTATGQEPELLRGDRMAAGVDEVEQLARAMRHNRRLDGDVADDVSTTTEDDDFLFVHSNMTKHLRDEMRIYAKGVRCTWMGSPRGLYGSYGVLHGEEYFKPGGWTKRQLHRDDFADIDGWPTAYHGTDFNVAARIIYHGGLRRPGLDAYRYGQVGSPSGRSIYVSPAIGFAAHPAYASFHQLEEQHWVQTVLQLKVRPGSYIRQSNSGRLGGWPSDLRIDPNFPTDNDIEWLLEDESDVRLIGVMFREFGPNIDTDVYEDLCSELDAEDENDAGRQWATLLQNHYREMGYFRGRRVWFDEGH